MRDIQRKRGSNQNLKKNRQSFDLNSVENVVTQNQIQIQINDDNSNKIEKKRKYKKKITSIKLIKDYQEINNPISQQNPLSPLSDQEFNFQDIENQNIPTGQVIVAQETKQDKIEINQNQKENSNRSNSQDSIYLHQNEQLVNEELYYNPYALPPDPIISQEHRKAWSIGPKEKAIKICKCCGYQTERKQLSLNCDTKEFSYLGSGISQFLMFIKFCIFLLLLLFLVSGVYGLITNSEGTDCKKYLNSDNIQEGCHQNWITQFSLGNKRSLEDKMLGQQLMNLLTICFIIVLFQFLRRQIRIIENECDDQDISTQDYTVIFKFLPKNFKPINDDYDEDLRQFLENPNNVKQQQYNVTSINLIYDTQQYLMSQDKLDILTKTLLKLELNKQNNKKYDQGKIDLLKEQINQLNLDLQFKEKQFHEGSAQYTKDIYTGQALVSFKTEQQKNQILEDYSTSYLQQVLQNKYGLIYHGQEIVVEEAPDPRNIQWENQQIKTLEKCLRRIATFFINTIILIGCCGIVISLSFTQKNAANNDENQNSDNPTIRYLGIIISGVILLLNSLISFLIEKLAEQESYSTFTSKFIGIAKCTVIAQFINTAITTFLINVYFSQDDKYYSIFKAGGLAYNIFFVFISNSIIPPILGIIDVPTRIQQILQKIAQFNIKNGNIVQKDLNILYEKPVYDISLSYAIILKTLYFSAFYSVIIPFGLLFSIFGLIAQYWIEKYHIVRKRTIKQSISKQLAIEMVEMLEYTLPIFAISNMIFFIYISDKEFPISGLVGVFISLVNAALPMQYINEKLFKLKESEPNQMEYEEAYYLFTQDYARENPATKTIAINLHKQKVHKYRQKISQDQNQQQLKNKKESDQNQIIFKDTQPDETQQNNSSRVINS